MQLVFSVDTTDRQQQHHRLQNLQTLHPLWWPLQVQALWTLLKPEIQQTCLCSLYALCTQQDTF